jgi:heme A synthase
MNRKTSKLAATLLTGLLYTQGLLGVAGVTLVVLKDRVHSDPAGPVVAMNVASLDARLR